MSEAGLPRRFAPQPVETMQRRRNNRAVETLPEAPSPEIRPKHNLDPDSGGQTGRRRFKVEPVEMSIRRTRVRDSHSSNLTSDQGAPQTSHQDTHRQMNEKSGRNRFNVAPLETSTRRVGHHAGLQTLQEDGVSIDKHQEASKAELNPHHTAASDPPQSRSNRSQQSNEKPQTPRKFAPQLIETSKRSRRSSGPIDEAESNDNPKEPRRNSGGQAHCGPDTTADLDPSLRRGRVFSNGSPIDITSHLQPRLSRSGSAASNRQHAFIVPSLDSIASSESEESKCPSLSTSPSASEGSLDPLKASGRMRESCDEHGAGYLLEIASKAAQNQFRDQAMAAFPNDDFHQPVDHFAGDRDSDDELSMNDGAKKKKMKKKNKPKSSARRDSAAEHFSELSRMRSFAERAKRDRSNLGSRGALPVSHSTTKLGGPDSSTTVLGGWQADTDIESMRKAASPPMLGQDLKFRMVQSPRSTKLYVDSSTSSAELPKAPSGTEGGLWNGYCIANGNHTVTAKPSTLGLRTPPNERECSQETDVESPGAMTGLDYVLSIEAEIEREFSDQFVTQVYNYLSLGYPALAQKFDGELSRISRVPLEEIWSDDSKGNEKGFVGLTEGAGASMDGVLHGRSGRWKALQLYIREWARQHPDMTGDPLGLDAWGVRARRGSWAL
ncbi:MAG: hypothetical protein M1825_002313 [Sarcosagium campestre]|nr:MAG: hypothetical protein M1825_002313 [Sarcosagium campestre]